MAETPDDETRAMLALAPVLRGFMDELKAKLPERTEIGILIAPPYTDDRGEARILALTTDRNRVAFLAAQWVLSVKDREEKA